MKVILQKTVPNLGDAGDIKDVADGYARNYLLPRKMVIPAHAGSTRAALHQKQLIKRKIEKRTKEMTAVAGNLKDLEGLDIPVRVGAKGKLFGSVTAMMVAGALKERGFEIDKRKIDLGDKIKALGTFKIKIRLAEDIGIRAGFILQTLHNMSAKIMQIAQNVAEEQERKWGPASIAIRIQKIIAEQVKHTRSINEK